MNKSNQKTPMQPQQKAKNPGFIEISMNPWFFWNLNHVGFYVNDQQTGQIDSEAKKVK